MQNKVLHMIAFVLVIVGALNWGLVGAFDLNLVTMLLGEGTMGTKVVYILVGLAAVWEVITHKGRCANC